MDSTVTSTDVYLGLTDSISIPLHEAETISDRTPHTTHTTQREKRVVPKSLHSH
jgi:hypothetical protein